MNKFKAMVGLLFLILKPILYLMLKKFFKQQMKAFIISAIEWLVIQTDNDLDDKILAKVKRGMKIGVVWSNGWASGKCNTFTSFQIDLWFFCLVTANYDWKMWIEVAIHWR